MDYAASPARSSFEVSLAGQSMEVKAQATGAAFKPVEIGTLSVGKAGEYTLHIKPAKKGWKRLDLRSVTLVPAEQ